MSYRGDLPPDFDARALAVPLRTKAGIEYWELANGYTEQWTPETAQLTRFCLVRRNDAFGFRADMLGSVGLIYDGSGALRLSRVLPESVNSMYCVGVDFVQGLNPGEGLEYTTNAFAYLRKGPRLLWSASVYACHFATLPYKVKSDAEVYGKNPASPALFYTVPELQRYVQREPDAAVEHLPIPGGVWVFQEAGSTPLNEPVPKVFNTVSIKYRWHRVMRFPAAAIAACSGRVNTAVFDNEISSYDWPFNSFPPETLLLAAVHPKVEVDFAGRFVWTVEYDFVYRNNGLASDGATIAGWNHFYRNMGGNAGKFVRVVDRATGTKGVYEKADFNSLFKVV